MDTTTNVLGIASLVRRIVEEVSVELPKGIGIFPTDPFPCGWCQDTSWALGRLLADRGKTGFQLVFAKHPDDERNTHVWLERGGLIVDITADQFVGSGCPGVMVTTDRSWHNSWTHESQDLDDVLGCHADGRIYSTVLEHPAWLAALGVATDA
jgi:hypothetical protein